MIGKVVRDTNILGTPVPDLLNKDGTLIDSGQISTAQKQLECKNDIYVMIVSWGHVHHYREQRRRDNRNLPGIRVPKCTRW